MTEEKTIIQFMKFWDEYGVPFADPFINGIWGEIVGREIEELEKWIVEVDIFEQSENEVLTIRGDLERDDYGHGLEPYLVNLRIVKRENWSNLDQDNPLRI